MNARSQATRVLMIEDNPGDARLIKEMLSELHAGFKLTTVERLEDGLKIYEENMFDTILLDLNLPDSRGIDTLSRVFEKIRGIPIIVLTGVHDEEIGTRAIREGAQDYLVKGQFDPALLGRAIQYAGERKRIEQALQESETRYKSLFDSSLDGIYQTDSNAVFVMINREGAEMLGYHSPEELIGKPALNMWADPDERKHFVDAVRRDKTIRAYPIRAKKRNGELIHLEVSSHVLEDEQGAFNGIEGVFRDVTERHKLEEQLLHSQKIEAIGTLAGGVAHDFNNILTAIIGYTYVVLMRLKKDDPLHYELQQVLAAADRAAMLTQSLLTFSRKQTVNLAPVDIHDIIKTFEAFLWRLIREDIELRTVVGTEELTVMADKGQIEQALVNLVTNAQDAMPDGGRLTIETKRVKLDEAFINAHGYGKAGDYALISVLDTGIGMDEQTRQKIFEPFFTTKGPGKGTGLGLALVYGTVKKHDGFINVYSEPGIGTTFNIYLPLTELPAEKKLTSDKEEAATVAGGTETILVAEDDEALRKLTATVLTDCGYSVITAVDGMDAIQKFIKNRDRIRLVILDGIMPKKNGKEAYEEIVVINPAVKVIFISGYAENLISETELREKKLTFIRKPVSPKNLMIKVREVLDGKA